MAESEAFSCIVPENKERNIISELERFSRICEPAPWYPLRNLRPGEGQVLIKVPQRISCLGFAFSVQPQGPGSCAAGSLGKGGHPEEAVEEVAFQRGPVLSYPVQLVQASEGMFLMYTFYQVISLLKRFQWPLIDRTKSKLCGMDRIQARTGEYSLVVKVVWPAESELGKQVLALPLISCVTLRKLLNLSHAQLHTGLTVATNLTYLRGFMS